MDRDKIWQVCIMIILVALALIILAFVLPLAFSSFAGSGGPLLGGNLIVQSGVFLTFTGTATGAFTWPPGLYNPCSISTISTDCLTALASQTPDTSAFEFGAYTIIELLGLIAIVVLLLLAGLYYYRNR